MLSKIFSFKKIVVSLGLLSAFVSSSFVVCATAVLFGLTFSSCKACKQHRGNDDKVSDTKNSNSTTDKINLPSLLTSPTPFTKNSNSTTDSDGHPVSTVVPSENLTSDGISTSLLTSPTPFTKNSNSTTDSDGHPVSIVVPFRGNDNIGGIDSDGHPVSTVIPSENLTSDGAISVVPSGNLTSDGIPSGAISLNDNENLTSDGAISVSPAPLLAQKKIELRRTIFEKAEVALTILDDVQKFTNELANALYTDKTNDEGNIYRWLFNMGQMYHNRCVWVADIKVEYDNECGNRHTKASKIRKDDAEKHRDDDKDLRDKAKKRLDEIRSKRDTWPDISKWNSKTNTRDCVKISDEGGAKLLTKLQELNDKMFVADSAWSALVDDVEADTTRVPD
jgi:hypothetical protein